MVCVAQGYASGSFGPTTAGRMDAYVEQFQSNGGSMVMLAKGNRSRQVSVPIIQSTDCLLAIGCLLVGHWLHSCWPLVACLLAIGCILYAFYIFIITVV